MRRMLSGMTSPEWPDGPLPGVRGRVSPVLTLWLVLVWVMVFGSLSWLTVLGGLLVALAVQVAFPLPHASPRWHWRVWPMVVLVVRFVRDMVAAGLEVAWLVLSGRHTHTGIVRVELRSGDPVHMTIVSAMTSLVPGTIVVRVARLAGVIYLHVLDVDRQGGPEGVRRAVLGQEARVLRAVAPDALLRDVGMDAPGGGRRG